MANGGKVIGIGDNGSLPLEIQDVLSGKPFQFVASPQQGTITGSSDSQDQPTTPETPAPVVPPSQGNDSGNSPDGQGGVVA